MKKLFVAIIAAIMLFSSTCSAKKPPLVLDEAIIHLNKPYVYATAGPDTFDCSGFIFYCFKKVENIELLRSAFDQGYDEKYEKIEKIKDLKPGDLVSFNTNKYDSDLCDHSGIYLGCGNFIHCSSGKGKVIISSLIKGYYNDCFSWGKRILRREINEYNDEARLTR